MTRIGTHIILDGRGVEYSFLDCTTEQVKEDFSRLLVSHEMTILDASFHDFCDPRGAFTGLFLLGESHMSIHTFPEERYIAIDIFVCNMSRDSTRHARDIIDECIKYFSIKNPDTTEIQR